MNFPGLPGMGGAGAGAGGAPGGLDPNDPNIKMVSSLPQCDGGRPCKTILGMNVFG